MYLTEKIGKDYESWQRGNLVFIGTPTGSGKTTFILDEFLNYAFQNGWKVLYLVLRTILKEQLEVELRRRLLQNPLEFEEKATGITFMTFQGLIKMLASSRRNLVNLHDVLVVDESHAILSDSAFNSEMWEFYEVVKNSKSQLRIFISATMDEFKELLLSDIPDKHEVEWIEVGERKVKR